jgi:dTDP-glucose pyrophosphorylase
MAAGIGSRFGTGIKQLEPVGLHEEIIMDYSIHDAIEAGFNKIIIIIRKDIEEDFKKRIGNRIESICEKVGVEVVYCFQDMKNVPENAHILADRTKPLGTGHAVLAAAPYITEPFCVINADDYYGKKSFKLIHEFLVDDGSDYCMAGFILKNTLSENGSVTRGICDVDEGYLKAVHETKNIVKIQNGAEADGKKLNPEAYVSMNMWGLTEKYIRLLKEGFEQFFDEMNKGTVDPMKGEYLLPNHIDKLLKAGKCRVKVLPTDDKWFGVTYKEDKEGVVQSFRRLIDEGVYKEELYSDLG